MAILMKNHFNNRNRILDIDPGCVYIYMCVCVCMYVCITGVHVSMENVLYIKCILFIVVVLSYVLYTKFLFISLNFI